MSQRAPRPPAPKGSPAEAECTAATKPTLEQTMRDAEKRYAERRPGRRIERDGADAFEAAAQARAENWILRQRVRVREELLAGTPLTPFTELEPWVANGLELTFDKAAQADDRAIEAAWMEEEARLRAKWERDREPPSYDYEPVVPDSLFFATDLDYPFRSRFARSEWRSVPPWELSGALVELGRAVCSTRVPLVGSALEELTAEAALLCLGRGTRVATALLVGAAVVARSQWLEKVERPASAPVRADHDVFIAHLAQVYGSEPRISDLVDVWAWFAPEDQSPNLPEAWRKRRDTWRQRRSGR